MEPTKFLWPVGLLLVALAFEAAHGIECFACSTTDIRCRKGGMNDNRAPTKDGCDYCEVLYANEPKDYVLRSCRPDPSGNYTKYECKDKSFEGEKQCFCMTDKCNGAAMDSYVRDLQRAGGGGGDGDGYNKGTTRPTSSAVSWRLSGPVVVGLMLIKMFIL